VEASPPGMKSLRDAETGLHLDDRVELCCDPHSNNDVGRPIVLSEKLIVTKQ
jgi:hypothetical protein